jgi:hypothetical protein
VTEGRQERSKPTAIDQIAVVGDLSATVNSCHFLVQAAMAAVEWPPVHDASAAEPGDRVGRHAYDQLAVDERCVENAFGFCWTGKQQVFVTCQMRSQLRTIPSARSGKGRGARMAESLPGA